MVIPRLWAKWCTRYCSEAFRKVRRDHLIIGSAGSNGRGSNTYFHSYAIVAAAAASALTFPQASHCDSQQTAPQLQAEPNLDKAGRVSVLTLCAEKDRPGLLADATDVLKKHGLEITEARISTTDDSKARHVYTVRNGDTGLTENHLAEIRKALAELGDITCESKVWQTYSQKEVSEHTTPETGIWVCYKNGVYDITDFVANHPGGKDKIMLAAGKSIEPFWRIYQQHESRKTAVETLERMKIGDLSDWQPQEDLGDDPYNSDPADRHPGLIFHNTKPCNAEVPPELTMDNWCTPNSVFFIRHHHPVPVVDANKFRIWIDGLGVRQVDLTLEDLQTRFLKREVTSTIQCGGNRRSELDKIAKTSGIPWGAGAVSNAVWGGVYLREVLMHCAGMSYEGLQWAGAKHVVCYGMDDMQASIPMEKALSPFGDVLLAYEMNGEPLPLEHGFPVRLVVPGVVGVRNVKWVSRISVSDVEAEGPWQRGIAYKGFSPMLKDCTNVDVESILSMQEMPVNSTIVSPKEGSITELDDIELAGWAWSGGGRGIIRVDVSLDDGETWATAELGEGANQNPTRAWAWTFWQASMEIPEKMKGKEIVVLCRATDSSYSTQPEQPAPIWNLRGLNCNCWHRVRIKHVDDDE